MSVFLIFMVTLVFFVFLTFVALLSRYRRCPSDKILVIYGKTGEGSAKCIHGGAAFVWPLFQDSSYLDLTPISIDIPLQGALSKENIRISAPSTFTVGISTDPKIITDALHSSIHTGKVKQKRGGGKQVTIGVHHSENGAYYANPVEFGHGGPAPAPAHPFVRPAFDTRADEAFSEIKRVLRDELRNR